MTATPTGGALGLRRSPGEGRRIWIAGDTVTLTATAVETGGRMSVIEVLASPGEGPPPHIHRREDEAFYVVEGEFEIQLGDEVRRAGPGSFAFAPRGTVHRFSNVGSAPARLLIAYTPGGFEGFFLEAGLPAEEGGEAPPLGPEEIGRSREAADRYGMEVAWPALAG